MKNERKFFKIRVAHTDTGEICEFEYFGTNPRRRIEKYRHADGRTDHEADLYAVVDVLYEHSIEQEKAYRLKQIETTTSYRELSFVYSRLDYIQFLEKHNNK